VNNLLYVGTIQGVLSVIAFFNSNFQTWFIEKMISYGYSDTRFSQLSAFRWYGVSSKLGYTMPATQAFLCVLTIYLAINYSKKYLLISPILLFSAIINARISVVIFLIGILLIMIELFRKKQMRIFRNFLLVFFIIIIIGIVGLNLLSTFNYNTYEWFTSGITGLFGNNDTAVYGIGNYFTDLNNYSLPNSSIQFFFGTGNYANGSNQLKFSSDIGYINDIWLGGIIYLILITGLFIYMSYKLRAYKQKDVFFLFISNFFILSFLVLNIKGYVFSINEFSTLFFVFYLYIFLNEGKFDENSLHL